jgi:hypothetical protein
MSNIMVILEYLHYRRQETVHNKSTTLCREWDSHYNINAQTHVQTSLRHRHHIANQLDRIQREATVATNLRASVTACTHSDNIPDYAARSQHINWAAENSAATSLPGESLNEHTHTRLTGLPNKESTYSKTHRTTK